MEEPHVLLMPFPAQGHIKPMLCLAQLLCHAGIHVTFLNTEHIHRQFTNRHAISAHFPSLRFESIPDGLPENHSRIRQNNPELIVSLTSVTKPLFKQLLVSSLVEKTTAGGGSNVINCVIADCVLPFAIDVAQELGIPVIAFRTTSACYLWTTSFCIPKLLEEGQLPFKDNDDLDQPVTGVVGTEGVVRRRDLPAYCREQPDDFRFQYVLRVAKEWTRASALILNTFDNLEGPILSQIAPDIAKIYTIGPLHSLVNTRIEGDVYLSCLTNLRQEDKTCMTWLDSQPLRSVLYVSFGSLIMLTRGELMEIWYGLVDSGYPFLWVIRSDLIMGSERGEKGYIPVEVEVGTKERGFIVEWAPQEEALAHSSIGGFWTHSGWNSTLESILGGVPMLCWPQFGDQQMNSRWVSEVWRIGVDMKDVVCDRWMVKKMVKSFMEDKREQMKMTIERFAKLAKVNVSHGGSSYNNLDQLIQDIRKF